jgi:hypothetical protein
MLAIKKHGADDDLCGSDRRSVTPYVHGRISVLYCFGSLKASAVPLVALGSA